MDKTDSINIMIVGVGGQGTLLASRIMGALALSEGLDIKVSEVHGMAQRGGSVETHVRMGQRVYSPLVQIGTADVVLAFEPLEGARWSHYLKPGGVLLTNSARVLPMPVISGAAEYPEDLDERLAKKNIKVTAFNATVLAEEAGDMRSVNLVLLGALSKYFRFTKSAWLAAIADCVPEKTLKVNTAAFESGRAAAQ
ncbi:MAG: indolepyruvate oxidoreductase subunit beta [Christensenellales bacterium]|jgi:indolepyruvate ferredoxin oxidoreductase beta subunit